MATGAVVKTGGVPAVSDDELVRMLQNSLYPGAKPDSIRMVLAWCKATGRDPMKRPVHIVGMSVKVPGTTDRYEWRDVLMPGIGTYRTDAANTGEYVGKTEPEFGPTIHGKIDGIAVSYPEWCRISVKRWVKGLVCDFPAKEYWLENYASGKGGKGVNGMWQKRAFGQLAKVAESQALRMAFPDETGNTYTQEEMEGKFDGPTLDAVPEPPPKTIRSDGSHAFRNLGTEKVAPATNGHIDEPLVTADGELVNTWLPKAVHALGTTPDQMEWLAVLERVLSEAPDNDCIKAIKATEGVQVALSKAPLKIRKQINDWIEVAQKRIAAATFPDAPSDGVDEAVEAAS